MSYESNKLLCAVLTGLLFYLLTSFIGDLIYKNDNDKKVSLSYFIEDLKNNTEEELEIKEEVSTQIDKDSIIALLKEANLQDGEKFIKKNCASCHDFDLPLKNKIGPSLANIINREIGSINSYKYSKALRDNTNSWSLLNLYLFLENPKEWAKGTKMSYRGIKDKNKLINTLKYLESNSRNNEN